ncbi:hypothetical protein PCE1_002387 [Barthelona sp. PCE]
MNLSTLDHINETDHNDPDVDLFELLTMNVETDDIRPEEGAHVYGQQTAKGLGAKVEEAIVEDKSGLLKVELPALFTEDPEKKAFTFKNPLFETLLEEIGQGDLLSGAVSDQWIRNYQKLISVTFGNVVELKDLLSDRISCDIIDPEYLNIFSDEDVRDRLVESKNYFDARYAAHVHDYNLAREKANPFGIIKKEVFVNRAAVKLAEIDAQFKIMERFPAKERDTLVFNDLCGGPGGFSEYLMWRRIQPSQKHPTPVNMGQNANVKPFLGFGITLRDVEPKSQWSKFHAFTILPAECAPLWQVDYGQPQQMMGTANMTQSGTGDITDMENIAHLALDIYEKTQDGMCHIVVADGGSDVSSDYNKQEWFMSKLILCEFLAALRTIKRGGVFVCKLFDVFTPFMISLIYVTSFCFQKTTIIKPVTSRPANSERYVVFEGCLRFVDRDEDVPFENLINYLEHAANSMPGVCEVGEFPKTLYPLNKMPSEFKETLKQWINNFAIYQTDSLDNIRKFMEDKQLPVLNSEDRARRFREKVRLPVNHGGRIPNKVTQPYRRSMPLNRQPRVASGNRPHTSFHPEPYKKKQRVK